MSKVKKAPKEKAPPAPAMVQIETQAQVLADTRLAVAKIVSLLKQGIKQVTDEHLPEIRSLSAEVGVAHDALMELIKSNKALFESPRSAAFHGIQVGYKKGKGKLIVENADKVIERIGKHFPDQLDMLAPSSRTLSLVALASLEVRDLKSIGVQIESAIDAPFIKTPADDTDKFVAQITAAYTNPATQE